MKVTNLEDFKKFLDSLNGADVKVDVKSQQDQCEGCTDCDDEDTDDELAAMVSALGMIDNAEDMAAAALQVLMVVAKEAGLPATSAAAHALWVDA